MDGFAVRATELIRAPLALAPPVQVGADPGTLAPGQAAQIATGAWVPNGADAVLRVEDAEIIDGARLSVRAGARPLKAGDNIRRRGENGRDGAVIARAGDLLTARSIAALAAAGIAQPLVRQRVRVAVITSGDEVVPPEEPDPGWKIRDTNGPAIAASIGGWSWAHVVFQQHVRDDSDALTDALARAIDQADAVITAGAVSVGPKDHMKAAVRAAGVELLYESLSMRPGKPSTGGLGPGGQPVLALPGNPVSVLVGMSVIVRPVLQALADVGVAQPKRFEIINPDGHRLGLWRYRPGRRTSDGRVELVETMGSGDVIGTARADGFVEIPPDEAMGGGPYPLYEA